LRKGFEVHGASRTGRRLVGLRRSFSKIRNLNFDLMRPYRWSLLSCYLKSTFHNGSSGGGATRSGNRSKSDQAIFNWRAVIRYRSTDANTCQPVVVTGSNWNQENDPTQTAHSARNTMSEKRSALGHFNCLGAVARGDCDHHAMVSIVGKETNAAVNECEMRALNVVAPPMKDVGPKFWIASEQALG